MILPTDLTAHAGIRKSVLGHFHHFGGGGFFSNICMSRTCVAGAEGIQAKSSECYYLDLGACS